MTKPLLVTYALTLILLVIYSYTQVDLNLTLSSNVVYQGIQKSLTYIGYFNRPLSTAMFVILLGLLCFHYFIFLRLTEQNKLMKRTILGLIVLTIGILFFSFPAFSHDIFNYIFDARIIGTYGLNPYQYKALDFPQDDWVRFMHWTHRTYPYGPLWVVLTLPFYLAGMGKFVLTLISFKLLFLLSYLGSLYLIYKIMLQTKKEKALDAVIWFGLNPLIIIESLVSPHNEITMVFFSLFSIYYALKKKIVPSVFFMLISAAIKFLTFFYIPILFLIKRNPSQFQKYIKIAIVITAAILIPVIHTRELYPWYLVPVIALASLIPQSRLLRALIVGVALGSLLRYAPYLYFGDYTDVMYQWQLYLTLIPIILLPLVVLILRSKSIMVR